MTDHAQREALIAPLPHLVEFALTIAMWSPCQSKRGVIVFDDGNIVSHGHNYKPQGFVCDGSNACKATCRRETIHAEQFAILSARQRICGLDLLHVKAVDGRLVASGPPSCVECSKLILAAGIAGVWLYHETGWRRYAAAEFHALSLAALRASASPAPEEVGLLDHWNYSGQPSVQSFDHAVDVANANYRLAVMLKAKLTASPAHTARTAIGEQTYYQKAIDLVADEIKDIKPEEFEGRRQKWIAVLRNAAVEGRPHVIEPAPDVGVHACEYKPKDLFARTAIGAPPTGMREVPGTPGLYAAKADWRDEAVRQLQVLENDVFGQCIDANVLRSCFPDLSAKDEK